MPEDPTAPDADAVWQLLARIVHENRDTWKRAVADRTGLPFSRIRVLRRLEAGALSVKQLASAAAMDAPAATVAVNDLEARGLVVREINPSNRRYKLVSLTAAGAATLKSVAATDDPAPDVFAALDRDELRLLHGMLTKLAGH